MNKYKVTIINYFDDHSTATIKAKDAYSAVSQFAGGIQCYKKPDTPKEIYTNGIYDYECIEID
ncbi:unnamed protein product [marine sediment metagenome]|uniref:Uncharacterized protein n=1 Tax=marine sediment metagenome TaxID=412755 RepID=X0V7Q0_9ZZZZ